MAFESLFQQIETESHDLIAWLRDQRGLIGLSLRRSARLPLAISLLQSMQTTIFWIVDRNDRALAMLEEAKLWAPNLSHYLFAEPSVLFYEKTPWSDTARKERLSVLTHFAKAQMPIGKTNDRPALVIASVRSVMTRTMPRREFLKAIQTYKPSSFYSLEQMTRQWSEMGYERVNTVVDMGQFARRGGILDIWPIASSFPVRLDFFGDQIETITPFDPTHQRTDPRKGVLSALIVPPAREYLLNDQTLAQVENPQEICEFHLPYLHPYPASVLDYLPEQSLLIVDDSELVRQTAVEIEEQALELRRSAIQEGSLSEDSPSPHLSWSEIEDQILSRRGIQFGWDEEKPFLTDLSLQQAFQPQPRFAGRLKSFIQHLRELDLQRSNVWVVSRQASRLEELWREETIGKGNG